MSLQLLPSKPSEVDIAVPLIYSSGPDAFEYVFKNERVGAIDFLKHAFVRKGGEFSYDNHYSLYWNDEMIGIGSIFNGKKANGFTLFDGLNIIRFYKLGCLNVIIKGLKVEMIIKLPNKKETALAHLAILPAYQGKGLGTKLVNKLMNSVELPTDHRFVLDVSEENPRAKALYDRLGFQVTKKMNSTLRNRFSYVPNHFRMEL